MSAIVPDAWMPDAPMRRVIVHWTAGAYQANAIDRAAYHILVEGSGKLVRGTHTIADNANTADGSYAAHTRGLNTGSIGVSMCCMQQCTQKPFRPGPTPMREQLGGAMLRVVAQLCRRYRIDVTPTTVLGHGEVQAALGVQQLSKWDPMVLPWDTAKSPAAVGALLRESVRDLLEPAPRVTVVVDGSAIDEDDAFLQDGRVFVAVDEVTRVLGFAVAVAKTAPTAEVTVGPGKKIRTAAMRVAGRDYVSGAELASAITRPMAWNPETRTITLS